MDNDTINVRRQMFTEMKEAGGVSLKLMLCDRYDEEAAHYVELEKTFTDRFVITIPNPDLLENECGDDFVILSREELIKFRKLIDLALSEEFISKKGELE